MIHTENLQSLFPIERRIFTIRGLQVMLDSDLAELYGVETKYINRAVTRNPERFPEEFHFSLTDQEYKSLSVQFNCQPSSSLRFQTGTLNSNKRGRHRKYSPKVFTEQGVTMLSCVLRSNTAVLVSIQIMKAFVAMRKIVSSQEWLMSKFRSIETRFLETDAKFEEIFKALEGHSPLPETGIFFNGQVFDAWVFISDLVRSAGRSIVLIDNYVDDTVLKLFIKRNSNVMIIIYTRYITPQVALEADKFNQQYGGLSVRQLTTSHDRFLIIDDHALYHIGASLKDLGKKWFAFSKIDHLAPAVLQKLTEYGV